MMHSVKKYRKSNFSERQIRTLVCTFADNKILLLSKHSTTFINEKKAAVWKEITDAVNENGRVHRTVNNCKKKWLELKRRAILYDGSRKQPESDGSPPPEKPWYVDYILDILGEDYSEINGGGESEETEQVVVKYDTDQVISALLEDEKNRDVKNWDTEVSSGLSPQCQTEAAEGNTNEVSPFAVTVSARPAQNTEFDDSIHGVDSVAATASCSCQTIGEPAALGHMKRKRSSSINVNSSLEGKASPEDLIDLEIKKLRLECELLNQKQKTHAEEVKAKGEREDVELEISKLQLQSEKVQLQQHQATLYKTNLEIRLLEKQLNMPTTDVMPLKETVHTEDVE
ncbi:uncharacterized protein LOC121368393 [Gigantopelta aegis]|uniref:uncharacterized protein LOC121368393 n=1 Tax=Gigantopelta aegis TaxID=1735272 RepID=UPI001B88765C|nr:uncharacterized protein LOC121368393 [Gigantopelta aegis]